MHTTTLPPADAPRYAADALYRRDVDRANAWQNIARRMDALAYRARVAAWLAEAELGHRDERGRYTVTARALGALTLTLADGTTRDIAAPVPLA